MLTENCIYTIRHSRDLEECYVNGATGQFEERREWKTGRRLLEDARRSGKRLPIIFAPAESTSSLIAWAMIDDIVLGATTRYSFSELRLFDNRPSKSTLKTARDGKRLSKSFIRPYAICRTATLWCITEILRIRLTTCDSFWSRSGPWRQPRHRTSMHSDCDPFPDRYANRRRSPTFANSLLLRRWWAGTLQGSPIAALFDTMNQMAAGTGGEPADSQGDKKGERA